MGEVGRASFGDALNVPGGGRPRALVPHSNVGLTNHRRDRNGGDNSL